MVDEHDSWQARRGIADTSRRLRYVLLRVVQRDVAPLHQLTAEQLDDWLAGLRITKSSRATYLVQLRGFYRWAVRHGHVATDPTVDIPLPRVPRRVPRPLEVAAVRRAALVTPRPVRTWITLGAWAGLRCVEIAALHGDDLRDGWLYVVGKGGHQRMVPAPTQVIAALAAHPKAGRLWHVDARTVSRVGNRWLRRAGAGGTMHQLRHTFATAVYENTPDLLVVQQLLGHATPATTAIYTHVSGPRLRDAVTAAFAA